MRVITNNPIQYSSACGCSSSFEGSFDSSNSSHVKEFQNYANSKGAKLVVDGKWGALTQAEWSKYGKEFRKANKPASSATTTPVSEPTPAQVEKQAKKGLAWDKVKKGWVSAKDSGVLQKGLDVVGSLFGNKDSETNSTVTDTTEEVKTGMSTTTKVLIGVGALALVSTIIYFATKKK